MSAIAPSLQGFFTERLVNQKRSSAHTLTAYRDTFRLLVTFASKRSGKSPSELDFCDLDATVIGAFLDYLEADRGNSARTRNSRLAAIHSMYRYAALQHPEHADLLGRVLAIPSKRTERYEVSFLEPEEVNAPAIRFTGCPSVQFGLDLQYPRLGQGASVFTVDLLVFHLPRC